MSDFKYEVGQWVRHGATGPYGIVKGQHVDGVFEGRLGYTVDFGGFGGETPIGEGALVPVDLRQALDFSYKAELAMRHVELAMRHVKHAFEVVSDGV